MLDVRKALMLGLLLTGMLVGTACAKTHRRVAHATGRSPVAFNIEDGHFDSVAQAESIARHYQVLVSFSDQPYVADLHRANPHLKVLMYEFADYATTRDPSGGMTCTTIPEDLVHPGWLARASSGAPVVDRTGDDATNIANPGFQQACVSRMIALAKRGGFDGIFLDGIDSRFSFALPSASLNPFGSDAAFSSATYSLLKYAASAVHASGLELFANMSPANSAQWDQWAAPLDGAEEESWTDGGLGLAQQIPWWHEKLANAAWSAAHGKYEMLHSYNPSEAANVYGLAAMLLVANGRASYTVASQADQRWFPEYTTAQRLGRALGGYRILRGGTYERVFANGLVLVNPTRHRVRRSLGGRYSGTHLHRVRAVALAPLTAVILLRAR